METQELQKNYDTLKRIHDAMVLGVQKMEEAMVQLRAETSFYKEQLVNADKNISIQKQVVINQIKQDQINTDSLVAEIMELKEKIKRLER